MQSEHTKITDCQVTSWTVNGKTSEQNLRDYWLDSWNIINI